VEAFMSCSFDVIVVILRHASLVVPRPSQSCLADLSRSLFLPSKPTSTPIVFAF